MPNIKPTPFQLFLDPLSIAEQTELSANIPNSPAEKRYLLEALQETLSLLTKRLTHRLGYSSESTITLVPNNSYNSADNLIHAVYAFAKNTAQVQIHSLHSNIQALQDLSSLTYPRGFKILTSEKEKTNDTANILDIILTDYAYTLDQIRQHYFSSEISTDEEIFADELTKTFNHLHHLVHQLKAKQNLAIQPSKIIQKPQVNIEAKYADDATVAASTKAKTINIEAQISAIENILTKSKEVIQKLNPIPSEDEDKNEIEVKSLHQKIREKEELLSDDRTAASILEKLPVPTLATLQYQNLLAAKNTLEKEGKVHIIKDLNPKKLSIALELSAEDEALINKMFERLTRYSKKGKVRRYFSVHKKVLRKHKKEILLYVNNKITALETSNIKKFRKPLDIRLQDIATKEEELAGLKESLRNCSNAVSHRKSSQSLAKKKRNLSPLLEAATSSALLLKQLRDKIDTLPTIEDKVEPSTTNIDTAKQTLTQIQNDIQTANNQISNLAKLAKRYQSTNSKENVANLLPLTQLQETLTQTSNLLDDKEPTKILNTLIEKQKIETQRQETLNQYQDVLKTEEKIRIELSDEFAGEKQSLHLNGRIGDYLQKRNRKYAIRDFFFACLPGSERTKRTDYLKELSILIKSYAEDDFKNGDERYLKLKEFVEQGIKDFKPRSNTSQQSLRHHLSALLTKIDDQHKSHKLVIESLRGKLPEPTLRKSL